MIKSKIFDGLNDKEFLQWIYDRLLNVHGENKHYDYMHRLRAIIKAVHENIPWKPKDKPEKVNLVCSQSGKTSLCNNCVHSSEHNEIPGCNNNCTEIENAVCVKKKPEEEKTNEPSGWPLDFIKGVKGMMSSEQKEKPEKQFICDHAGSVQFCSKCHHGDYHEYGKDCGKSGDAKLCRISHYEIKCIEVKEKPEETCGTCYHWQPGHGRDFCWSIYNDKQNRTATSPACDWWKKKQVEPEWPSMDGAKVEDNKIEPENEHLCDTCEHCFGDVCCSKYIVTGEVTDCEEYSKTNEIRFPIKDSLFVAADHEKPDHPEYLCQVCMGNMGDFHCCLSNVGEEKAKSDKTECASFSRRTYGGFSLPIKEGTEKFVPRENYVHPGIKTFKDEKTAKEWMKENIERGQLVNSDQVEPMIKIEMSREEAELLSMEISDFLCWIAGFDAGHGDESGYDYSLRKIQDFNITLKGKVWK